MIIIPRKGCSSCIGMADYFFKENYTRDGLFFIFTKVSSKKTLRIKLGSHSLTGKNTHLDKGYNFSSGALNSLYPLVVEVNNGKVEDSFFLTPDSKFLLTELQERISAN